MYYFKIQQYFRCKFIAIMGWSETGPIFVTYSSGGNIFRTYNMEKIQVYMKYNNEMTM